MRASKLKNCFSDMLRFLNPIPGIDRVVIAALWPRYFASASGFRMEGDRLTNPVGERKTLASFGSMIRRLREGKKQVTVILAAPYGEELDPRTLCERSFFGPASGCPPRGARMHSWRGTG